jgi:hypothetical protein
LAKSEAFESEKLSNQSSFSCCDNFCGKAHCNNGSINENLRVSSASYFVLLVIFSARGDNFCGMLSLKSSILLSQSKDPKFLSIHLTASG